MAETMERTKEEPMEKATQAPQTGDCTQDGYTPVQGRNGTASAATASESGVSWLDSAALAECRRLTAENAALTERNAELRAALDEQGDELAALRREAASVPTELESGRLLIVADSIASDGEGLRTIEAYGQFFEREDGGRDGWMKLPVDADGVPIRVGDTLAWRDGTRHTVTAVAPNAFTWEEDDGQHMSVPAHLWHHAKPRTLEDVLRELADEVIEWSGYSGPVSGDRTWSGMAKKYADEIRELMVSNPDLTEVY
jgi:hypothetical protein